jgi:hypothetical protein
MTASVRRKTHHRLANRSSGVSNSRRSDRDPSQAGQYEPMPNMTRDDGQHLDINIMRSDASSIERLGADLDPFESLPVKLHFSTLKLLEYCM